MFIERQTQRRKEEERIIAHPTLHKRKNMQTFQEYLDQAAHLIKNNYPVISKDVYTLARLLEDSARMKEESENKKNPS